VMGDARGNWSVLLALGALFVIAESRDLVFVDETGLSGSIAVAVAAGWYFGTIGWEGGAFLVCMMGGLYMPQLRAKEWSKVVVNAASLAISGTCVAFVVGGFVNLGAPTGLMVLVSIPAAVTYWVVNCVLLALATTTLRGGRFPVRVAGLIRSDTAMLVFAVGGALCGLVMTEVGTWAGIATLSAALVALDVFVISVPAATAGLGSAWKILLTRALGGVAAGLVSMTVTAAVSGGVIAAAEGLGAGIVAGTLVVVAAAVARLVRARHSIDLPLLAGFALAELPLILVAAIAGVVAALGGAPAGFVVASMLVVLASVGAAWRRRCQGPLLVDEDVLLAAVTEAIIDGLPQPAPQR